MQITFVTRKFRNGQHSLHCDVVGLHITNKLVFCLTLDCNGVFAIKAYNVAVTPVYALCQITMFAGHVTQVTMVLNLFGTKYR